jgi:membrane-bound ClpP family serine protease
MYEAFRNAKIFAVMLIIGGILIFAAEFFPSFSISLLGVVTFSCGLAILSVIHAMRTELEKLRIELIELRNQSRGR